MDAKLAMALAVLAAVVPLGAQAVQGGAKAYPYDQAVASGLKAAHAVLGHTGTESCLRGKLTNAMLGLSASCEASGQRNPLCQLADQAAVITGLWTVASMEETARKVIDLAGPEAARKP
jgi:phage protein U